MGEINEKNQIRSWIDHSRFRRNLNLNAAFLHILSILATEEDSIAGLSDPKDLPPALSSSVHLCFSAVTNTRQKLSLSAESDCQRDLWNSRELVLWSARSASSSLWIWVLIWRNWSVKPRIGGFSLLQLHSSHA